MIQKFLSGPPLQRRIRLGATLLLCLLAAVGIFNFVRTSRGFWMNSVSVDSLKTESKKHPADADLNYTLAYRMHQDGRNEEAYQTMLRLTQQYPDDAKFWLGLARCAAGAAHSVETVNAYRKALELNPNQASAYMLLGQLYSEAGLYSDALDAFEHGYKADPNVPVNIRTWIQALDAKGRTQEVWDRTTAALQQNPKQYELYEYIYTAGIALGKTSDAQNILYNSLGVLGSYHGSEAKSALARLMIVKDQDETTLNAAEQLAGEAAKGQGLRAEDFAALAQVKIAKHELKEARAILQQGFKEGPNDLTCLKTLLEVAKREGNKPEAAQLQERITTQEEGPAEVRERRKAVQASPKNAQAHLALASVLAKEEQYAPAAEECHEALKIVPNNAAATTLLEEYRVKALKKLEKASTARHES